MCRDPRGARQSDILFEAPRHSVGRRGRTFRTARPGAQHHHAIWINPKNSNHVRDRRRPRRELHQGATGTSSTKTGQFCAISADIRKPYHVRGLQDNGSWCGPSAKRNSVGILNSDWFRVGGGDGFYTSQDPTDWAIVYAESQDGNVNRLDLRKGTTTSIRPRAPRAAAQGGPSPEQLAQTAAQFGMQAPGTASHRARLRPPAAFRFFWNTPTVLSPHPDIVGSGQPAVHLGEPRRHLADVTGTSHATGSDFTRPIWRAGDAPMASKHDGAATTSVITTVPNRRSCRASSGRDQRRQPPGQRDGGVTRGRTSSWNARRARRDHGES
jgi:hypothetical protein